MRAKLKLKYRLKVLFNPLSWVRIHQYDEEWDNFISDSLDAGKIELVGFYEALIDGRIVWIANHPYGSGATRRTVGMRNEIICSRVTAMYLHDQLIEARIIQALKGPYDDFDVFAKTGIRL